MPSSNLHYDSTEIFLRREPLTEEELVGFIENRRRRISRHIDSFTLQNLGQLECLRRGTFNHAIAIDDPVVLSWDFDGDEWLADGTCSLKTQGLFSPQSWDKITRVPDTGYQTHSGMKFSDGLIKVWGLTRDNRWALVHVYFTGEPGNDQAGYERATRVEIWPSDISKIMEETHVSPLKILAELTRAITYFTDRRKGLYEAAASILSEVEQEDQLIHSVMRKAAEVENPPSDIPSP